MNGKLESIKIKNHTIKKGTHASIDIWNDGKEMEVTVTDLTLENGEVNIECMTHYGNIIHHTYDQWVDMLVKTI